MGLAKYFEDNYEMYLERTDEHQKNDVIAGTTISINITPVVRLVNNSNTLINTDKKIRCKECGDFFNLTVGEQKFYQKHNLCNPKRCKRCREIRKSKAS